MAKVDIWMPVYIGDYMANTMRLTTEQHGAYMLMLMEQWVSGPLPDDDEALAAITKLPLDRWLMIREKMAKFFAVHDGLWTQGRLEKERLAAQDRRDSASNNGKKGGRPRTPKQNPEKTHRLSEGKPDENPEQTRIEPVEKPEHNPEESSSPSPLPLGSKEPNKTFCIEPVGSPPPAESKVVYSLPTNKHNTEGEQFHVTEPMFDKFCELYPAVDVLQAFRAMEGWLLAEPSRRKTLGGMTKFINTWLAKDQNRGGNHGKTQLSAGPGQYPARAPTPSERVEAKRIAAGSPDVGVVVENGGNVRPHLVAGPRRRTE